MKKAVIVLCSVLALPLQAQQIDLSRATEISPYIFGHNLEHTRSAVIGGLSAQMLKNRKFAGKPAANLGICAHWFPIGERAVFLKDDASAYTRHICLPGMNRMDERAAQIVENLKEGEAVGIGQHGLTLVGGREYELRTVTHSTAPVRLTVSLTNADGSQVYANHTLTLSAGKDWVTNEFRLTPGSSDDNATIRYTFTGVAEVFFGALSMMPKDNFHGMRSDVVENLRQIGPRLLRWPGGNFAGEYRWKDGLLPVDERAPLQSYNEIHTHPHTEGYDYHEIGTDDFIALCREVGAEPMLTINLAWQSAEESRQWVEYCNGTADTEYGKMRAERGHPEPYNVHFWALGNEMGHGHMEGPNSPKSYTEYALRHANAMLEVTPDLEFLASGPNYLNKEWAEGSASVMSDKVRYNSLHGYFGPTCYGGGNLHYTTPEDALETYNAVVESVFDATRKAERTREILDATGKKLHIAFDEWNQWYAWHRPSCVAEGIFTARMLHFFINRSDELDIPIVCYFQPVGEGAIIITPKESHLTANGQMFALMKEHQDGRRLRVQDNDDLSTAATLRNDILTITLINTEYAQERAFRFPLKGKLLEGRLYTSDEVGLYTYLSQSPLDVTVTRKDISTVLPPHSVAVIRLKVKTKK